MDFLEVYLERGFGSMNKNDVEVLVFRILLDKVQNDNPLGLKGLSDYVISVRLKIPESKVKRLRYEAELKYPISTDEQKKKMLLDVLNRVQYKKDKEKIQILVSNKMLRLYISDLLSQGGRFFDTSFNSNIVSIDIDDFCFMLNDIYSPEEVNEIIKAAKKSLSKKRSDFPKDKKEIFQFAAKAVLEGLAKAQFGDFAVDKFKEVILQMENSDL